MQLQGTKPSIYINPALANALQDRFAWPAGNLSQTLTAIAERYSDLVRRSAPSMTAGEWRTIYRILHFWDHNTTAIGQLASLLEDAMPRLRPAEGWGIDEAELLKRASGWDFATRLAVIDTCERLAITRGPRQPWAQALKALGVIVAKECGKP